MIYLLFFAVIAAIVSVVFALQNAEPVTVSFLVFEFESSLALILLLSLAAGIFIGAAALAPKLIRNRLMISNLNKKLKSADQKAVGKEPVPPVPAIDPPLDS